MGDFFVLEEDAAHLTRQVVRHGRVSGEPGEGFYNFAETLYGRSFETKEEKIDFWHEEMEKVYKEWSVELESS